MVTIWKRSTWCEFALRTAFLLFGKNVRLWTQTRVLCSVKFHTQCARYNKKCKHFLFGFRYKLITIKTKPIRYCVPKCIFLSLLGGSEPKRAYYAVWCVTNDARVIAKNALRFLLGFRYKLISIKTRTHPLLRMGSCFYGVRYGARTHDLQGHNLTR